MDSIPSRPVEALEAQQDRMLADLDDLNRRVEQLLEHAIQLMRSDGAPESSTAPADSSVAPVEMA